jgi:hypothetical protein
MTDADKSRLLDLWASGATASEIAGELGVSRNSVIGKVTRARAKGDVRAVSRAPSRPHKPKAATVAVTPKPKAKSFDRVLIAPKPLVINVTAPTPVELPPAPEPVPLVDCRPGCCRWPVSRDERGHLFCDVPVEPGQRPQWCSEHRAIGFSARAA